jgi:hypothetical protein
MRWLLSQSWFWWLVVLLELLICAALKRFRSNDREMAAWEKTRQRMNETAFAWLYGAFAWGGINVIFWSAAFATHIVKPDPFVLPVLFIIAPAIGYVICKSGYREMEAKYQAYLMQHAAKQSDSTELLQG